jgi:transglutaminase-like putative cysteine protease
MFVVFILACGWSEALETSDSMPISTGTFTPSPSPPYSCATFTDLPVQNTITQTSTFENVQGDVLQYGSPEISDTIEYKVQSVVTLENIGDNPSSLIKLWVALIQNLPPYQSVLSMDIQPVQDEFVRDSYSNLYALFVFEDVQPGEMIAIEISYSVIVNALKYTWSDCQGPVPDKFIYPEKFLQSSAPELVDLSDDITANATNFCEKAEYIYNYVGDNFNYQGYNPGDLGALGAYEKSGGDCTEFSDMFIALNRSSGVPARFLEGLIYSSNDVTDPASIKHDWAEVYLPGTGWVPVDPTWGRFEDKRDSYFAAMTPDHIIITIGRNLSQLNGYHFYYYRYWWENGTTEIVSDEGWLMERVGE